MISFDTDILVYAADNTAGASRDRRRSDRTIDPPWRLRSNTQSLTEFFSVVTRKPSIAPDVAASFIKGWQAVLPIEASTPADLDRAMQAAGDHSLAFWDAMLWATARRIGVRVLISEDFQDGRILDGVRFIDPFASQNSTFIEQLLR